MVMQDSNVPVIVHKFACFMKIVLKGMCVIVVNANLGVVYMLFLTIRYLFWDELVLLRIR